jgi:hypothetical protein
MALYYAGWREKELTAGDNLLTAPAGKDGTVQYPSICIYLELFTGHGRFTGTALTIGGDKDIPSTLQLPLLARRPVELRYSGCTKQTEGQCHSQCPDQ